jgi:hypothetical protein
MNFNNLLALLLALLSFYPAQATQTVMLEQDARVEASICPDSMNRIAVANDRITQIFGDEGTFESQNDDNTGQVFLKPTVENGTKDLSLTLITEQGITQDLILKPTAKSATTLVLKNKTVGRGTNPGNDGLTNPFEVNAIEPGRPTSFAPDRQATHQDRLLVLLKQVVTGHLSLQENPFYETSTIDARIARTSADGIQLSHQKSYAVGTYGVDVFQVENTLETASEMQERTFYQSGDLAISLQRRVLSPGAKTHLHVVRLTNTLEVEHE